MTTLDQLFSNSNGDRRESLIMGILNVTPDSFYDGGKYDTSTRALERARIMANNGADLIDIGGESTRPGADPVSVEDERNRVIPVVRTLTDELSVPISVDTSKPAVAREALKAGAFMINDVTGLEDPDLLGVVAEFDCPVCIMHMQGTPRTMQKNPEYDSVVEDVKNYLNDRAQAAIDAGVAPEKIIVDPGIGFGKSLEHNRRLLTSLPAIRSLGYRILIGHSRKSFIGDILDRQVDDRLAATLAVSARLLEQNVDVLRVHDVREHADLLRINRWFEG